MLLIRASFILACMISTPAVVFVDTPDSSDNRRVNTVAGENEAMPMAEVELDIFSGMPNPIWTLTDDEAESFASRLAALSPISAAEPVNNLGYRGFLVQLTQGADVQSVRIFRSVVEVSRNSTKSYVRDRDRALEWWLLSTGKPHMTEDVFQLVEREMR